MTHMDIRAADSSDRDFLLDLYMSAFPASERKPFSMIEQKTVAGEMETLVICKNGERAGLAITAFGDDIVLLDYFAICEKMRGNGCGSEALQLLLRRYADRQFYLEIEKPDEAEPDNAIRLRRKKFYLRNGLQKAGIDIDLFGVKMELLSAKPALEYAACETVYRRVIGPAFRIFVKRIN